MSDIFKTYENGLDKLLKITGNNHLRYSELLTLQARLLENIKLTRLYGDSEARRADRAQILSIINQLAIETAGISFNQIIEEYTKTLILRTADAKENLPSKIGLRNQDHTNRGTENIIKKDLESRKHDLEDNVNESYHLIHEYEIILRLSDDPKEKLRSQRNINEQWQLIRNYLDEYIPLCENLQITLKDELIEIIARFPEYSDQLQASMLRLAPESLLEELHREGLSDPKKAGQSIAATIPSDLPLLFQSGLCAGFPLEPSPQQYFVAQEFSPDRDDLLRALEGAFQNFKLKPYRADQDVLPGHILCKIAAKIQTSLFSVFELTRTQNRNVYLELGIAIGLRRSFVLVKEADAEISQLSQGLNYYNIHSYLGLQKELGSLLKSYLLNITRYHPTYLPAPSSGIKYIIAHGDFDMPPDFCLAVAGAIPIKGNKPLILGNHNEETINAFDSARVKYEQLSDLGHTKLDLVVQAIQAARFGVYRVDSLCSPDVFLMLGIAIGLNRPWLIVSREGAVLPSDIRGLSGLSFRSFSDLGSQLKQNHQDFLRKYA